MESERHVLFERVFLLVLMKLPLSHDCPPFSYLHVSSESLAAVAEKHIIRGWDFFAACLYVSVLTGNIIMAPFYPTV